MALLGDYASDSDGEAEEAPAIAAHTSKEVSTASPVIATKTVADNDIEVKHSESAAAVSRELEAQDETLNVKDEGTTQSKRLSDAEENAMEHSGSEGLADDAPTPPQAEQQLASPSHTSLTADLATFSAVVDRYIAKATAGGGEGPPPEYKASMLEVFADAPPHGKQQMLTDMVDLVNQDDADESGSEQEEQEEHDRRPAQTELQSQKRPRVHAPLVDESVPFSKVIDIYIAQAAASGDGPPPEYKDEILEIYQNAPPEGQEEMLRDMRDLVNKEAEEQAPEPEKVEASIAGKVAASQQAPSEQGIEENAVVIAEEHVPEEEEAVYRNPRVFLEIAVDGISIGKIEFELFADIVPKTAENFRCLCTGEKGRSEVSKNRLSFHGCDFHRIIPGFMCQGGDFTKGDGTGGESIYGTKFPDENFDRKHTKGCLSMANSGPNTNGSQFFICTDATTHLDGKHVVFGEVSTGYDVVLKMEALGSRSGRVSKKVRVLSCGMLDAGTGQRPEKRAKVAIDFAPAPRLVQENPDETCSGGLLGLLAAVDAPPTEQQDASAAVHGGLGQLLQERDSQVIAVDAACAANSGAPRIEPVEVHVLHILRKHAGSRKPKSRGGAPITCSQEEAEEYLEEIANQLIGLPLAQMRKQFSDLAHTESDCASAKKGGDYGRFKRGQREEAFEDAAFALDVGEMSDLVITASGVHVILRVP